MPQIQKLIDKLTAFRDARDWAQFHDARNLALALSIEASELNELFLWKKEEDVSSINQQRLREELADVFAYALMMADRCGFDVEEIILQKLALNEQKYPVDKAKGTAKKYDEL
jgi:NTP pyrophosphatase (non-canonical NTP hydrolase)